VEGRPEHLRWWFGGSYVIAASDSASVFLGGEAGDSASRGGGWVLATCGRPAVALR